MTKIQTTRFGAIDANEEHVIHFRDGMIGFSALKRYILIESPSMPLVLWLQSMDNPEVAFPVIEPYFFKKDFRANLNEADQLSIGFMPEDRLKVFSVLTIPDQAEKMTVNLKAPVVINIKRGLASQVILQDKALEVRMPAHEAFERAMANVVTSYEAQGQLTEESILDIWNAVDVRTRPTYAEASL